VKRFLFSIKRLIARKKRRSAWVFTEDDLLAFQIILFECLKKSPRYANLKFDDLDSCFIKYARFKSKQT